MPCQTSEDREAIWNAIPDLARSFVRALSLPKLGRWFSWNECAKEQLCEFRVSKMLLEYYFQDVSDPDEDGTSFNDIATVAQSGSAAAQLQAMRKLGGCLKLAYKLTTTPFTGKCQYFGCGDKVLLD